MTVWLKAVLLISIAASSMAQEHVRAGIYGGTLRVAQRAEPKTLNPLLAMDGPSREVIRLLHADLITINRGSHRTEPALAASWRVSNDGRVYTLQLRRGVRFSDGQPFTAEDVLFTLSVYTDKEVAAPQRDLLMVGGVPVAGRKTGTHTVEVTLAQPYAAAERLFDGIPILPKHLLEADYRAGRISKVWTLASKPEQMAGLGAFRFRSHRPGEAVTLERNPHYWKADANGGRLPYLDAIEFRTTGSEENQVVRFLSGEVDILGRLTAASFRALEQKQVAGIRLVDAGSSLEYNAAFFNLNTTAPPAVRARQRWFQDKRFRQALSLAADREGIVRLVYGGKGFALWSHVPPGNRQWVDREIAKPGRSIAGARGLLQKAGYRWHDARLVDASGAPVQFSILVSSSNTERMRMAAILASDWRELGADVQVAGLEFRAVLDRVTNTKDFDVCLLGLGGGDADPNPEMNVWLSSGSMHFWNPNQAAPATPWEARLDVLMKEQMITLDRARRFALFREVQQILAEERPLISLASPNVLVAARDTVGNFRPAILDSYTLWNAEHLYRDSKR